MGVTGPELLLVGFNALTAEEQEEAFELISAVRLRRLAGQETDTGRMLRSMRQIDEHLGDKPLNSVNYRKAWAELRAQAEDVVNLTTLIKHFGGSWAAAREAYDLSATNTAKRIRARYDLRRLGRIKQYPVSALKEAVESCMRDCDLETPPRLAEYLHWRQGKLELARAQGHPTPHLPTGQPFRRRWKTWPKALRNLGFSEEEIEDRLDQRGEKTKRSKPQESACSP